MFEGLVRMVSLCWSTLVFMYPGCSLKLLFGGAFFFKYITDLPAYVIYNIVIYGDDTTLDFKWDRLLICGNSLSQLLNVNLTYESLCVGIGSCLLTSMLGKLNLFYFIVQVILVLLMWKRMGVYLIKNHILRC